MASTASDLIKFEKQATGENADTWGTKANTAMSRLEEAIAGYTAITMVGANYTLDDTQYVENTTTTAESHLAFIKVNGTPGASYKVVVPLRTKIYTIWNNVTTYDITVGGSTGDTVTIPNGKIAQVMCDGTNVELISTPVSPEGIIHHTKGADIASASPLVIGTDGDMFDVTGTTAFAAMTVAANRLFILQWDGIVTVTHGASLVLPGGANLTTAAGDVWTCYSTAANTVIVTNVATAAAEYATKTRTIRANTGTTDTLVIGDAGNIVTSSNASAQTVTIPPNSSVAFPVGTQIDIINKGAGVTSVAGGSGVTVNGVSTGTGAIDDQYKAVTIIKDATNTWFMVGAHGAVA